MSKVPARWEHVDEVVAMRDRMGIDIPVLGNGDVASYSDGVRRAKEVGADGFMVGRGLFGNPWFFAPEWRDKEIPLEEKLRVLMEHTDLFEEVLGAEKNFMLLKKHYRLYVTGFDGAAEFRASLMEATSAAEVRERVQAWYHSRYGVFIP
jgi:tRNA-dihydrouridine synthase